MAARRAMSIISKQKLRKRQKSYQTYLKSGWAAGCVPSAAAQRRASTAEYGLGDCGLPAGRGGAGQGRVESTAMHRIRRKDRQERRAVASEIGDGRQCAVAVLAATAGHGCVCWCFFFFRQVARLRPCLGCLGRHGPSGTFARGGAKLV